MRVEKDFEEFIGFLNRYNVRYCIIGAYAFAFHAEPRYTKDIDILIDPTEENSKILLFSLNEFGFASLKLHISDFMEPGNIIQLGYEPVRIDIISSIKGMPFDEVWKNKVEGKYGSGKAFYADIDTLIKLKEISSRKKDLADIDTLKKLKKKNYLSRRADFKTQNRSR